MVRKVVVDEGAEKRKTGRQEEGGRGSAGGGAEGRRQRQ